MDPKPAINLVQHRMRDLCENIDFVATLFGSLIGYAIIAADFGGNIIAYNEGAREIYGYAPEEVIGKESIEIFFPEDFIEAGKLEQIISDLIRKERYFYEGKKVRRNGERFPAQILLTVTKDKSGKAVGFVVIAQDLTKRHRLLGELKQKSLELEVSRKSFHGIIEKSADGIIVVDPKGIVRFINSAAISQFKKKRQDLLGQQFCRPIVSGEITEVDMLRADGTKGLAEMRVVDTDWEGKPAYLVLLRDVTDLKKAEELLVRQTRLAAMGALASIVGHEVRGPLSVIKNSAEFLEARLSGSLDEKARRHLDILKEEVNASDKVIDDILGFVRVKELAVTTVDLNSIVEATLARVTVPASVKIVRRLRIDLPLVCVDASQIGRVLLNIIINSLDAMCKGGTLTIVSRENSPKKQGHRLVEISFQDTGVGIPKENLARIFEPLFTTKSKGTGLGLTICQNIVRNHKGEIQIQSEVGKGTTVTVKLPV